MRPKGKEEKTKAMARTLRYDVERRVDGEEVRRRARHNARITLPTDHDSRPVGESLIVPAHLPVRSVNRHFTVAPIL